MENGKPIADAADAAAPQTETPGTETAAMTDAASNLAALAEERDRLAAEKQDLHERWLRKAAEFDNFRRRTERERSEWLEFAGMEAVRQLLPIVDDFERALKVESQDKEYARGIELIYARMIEVLKKLGLEPIEAAGKPFDPNFHEAVQMVQREDVEDHTVVEEFERGYNFRGKLLRPAKVVVASK